MRTLFVDPPPVAQELIAQRHALGPSNIERPRDFRVPDVVLVRGGARAGVEELLMASPAPSWSRPSTGRSRAPPAPHSRSGCGTVMSVRSSIPTYPSGSVV